MHRPILLMLLLLATATAGCLSPGDGPGPEVPADDCPPSPLDPEGIRIVEPNHDPVGPLVDTDRWDFAPTNVRTCGLPAIGHHPLGPDGVPHKYLGEIDFRGDLGLGAVAVLGNQEAPGVYLLDITDRARPEVLSFIPQAGTYVTDVKLNEDGTLLLAASQNLPGPEVPDPMAFNAPTGFTVYDISDPAEPQYLTTVAEPSVGCHMLASARIDGAEHVFCVGSAVRIYRLVLDPVPHAVLVSSYFPEVMGVPMVPYPVLVGNPGGLLPLPQYPHDMTVQTLRDGRTVMTVSHWSAGIRVVDVSNPLLPVELGAWNGEGATHYSGHVHTAMVAEFADRTYVIGSPEVLVQDVVPSFWVLDATDGFDAMRLVAEWFHPNEHPAQGLLLTLHQWQIAPTGPDAAPDEARIYVTMNRAGVWVLDFGKILEGDMEGAVLGFNLARQPLDQDTDVANAPLATWDVNVVDGYIYGSDRATGLWIFHYGGDGLGDPRLNGFA